MEKMRIHRLLWFLFGLGSQLQLFGTSLCFTEVFVYLATPILLTREWPYMKRNGITTFFWLAVGVMINGALSCVYNNTGFWAASRGMAIACLLPCAVVVSHWMLRKDMPNVKWYIVGNAMSGFLCTFVFHKAVDIAQNAGGVVGSYTSSDIIEGPIWLIQQVSAFCSAYPKGWYLQSPLWLSSALVFGSGLFSLFSSVSGRSAALGGLGSAILIVLGGKKSAEIKKRVCERFWLICFVSVLGVSAFKTFYQTAALNGWLGEESYEKYEKQTRGGEDVVSLLLGGRMESFAGLIACVDQPIIGFGPHAIDNKGYTEKFLSKYGNADDYAVYKAMIQRQGYGYRPIHSHSYITQFWLWFGILGLVFWIYVLFILVRYMKQDCYAVPHWFMWLAAGIPGYTWGVFFSPLSDRIGCVLFVVAILLVRAVRFGKFRLPFEMLKEIK